MIPDGLPTLAPGAHNEGDGKACVMEFVSVLAGEQWSDKPNCTLLPIAYVAQRVNDVLSDENRNRLLPLIPRLIGTNPDDDAMKVKAAKAILVTLIDKHPNTAKQAMCGMHPANIKNDLLDMPDTLSTLHRVTDVIVRTAVHLCNNGCGCVLCRGMNANDPSPMQVLEEVLDAYDRFMGRGTDDMVEVSEERYAVARDTIWRPDEREAVAELVAKNAVTIKMPLPITAPVTWTFYEKGAVKPVCHFIQ